MTNYISPESVMWDIKKDLGRVSLTATEVNLGSFSFKKEAIPPRVDGDLKDMMVFFSRAGLMVHLPFQKSGVWNCIAFPPTWTKNIFCCKSEGELFFTLEISENMLDWIHRLVGQYQNWFYPYVQAHVGRALFVSFTCNIPNDPAILGQIESALNYLGQNFAINLQFVGPENKEDLRRMTIAHNWKY